MLQLALLALETRTAYTVDSAPHTLDGKAADAFATAISDGLLGLAALPVTSAASHQHDTPRAAVSCPTTAEHVSPRNGAANLTDVVSPILAKDADPLTATDVAAQHESAAASETRGVLDSLPSLRAHGLATARQPQHGSHATPPAGAGSRSWPRHASDPAGGCEMGALLLGLCTGLQCLQSLAARERAFRLAPESVARMAHAPWQLLNARSVSSASVSLLFRMHAGPAVDPLYDGG